MSQKDLTKFEVVSSKQRTTSVRGSCCPYELLRYSNYNITKCHISLIRNDFCDKKTHKNTSRASLVYMWSQCEREAERKSLEPKYWRHDDYDMTMIMMMMMTTQQFLLSQILVFVFLASITV